MINSIYFHLYIKTKKQIKSWATTLSFIIKISQLSLLSHLIFVTYSHLLHISTTNCKHVFWFVFYLTATNFCWIPCSAFNILALANAIERRFLAPLKINSTLLSILQFGVSILFNIYISRSFGLIKFDLSYWFYPHIFYRPTQIKTLEFWTICLHFVT